MSVRRQHPKSLRRSVGQRAELRTIVVFIEGRNSEVDYITGLRRLPHVRGDVSLRVEIHPEHRVPLTLVRIAVERSREPEVDECWCISWQECRRRPLSAPAQGGRSPGAAARQAARA